MNTIPPSVLIEALSDPTNLREYVFADIVASQVFLAIMFYVVIRLWAYSKKYEGDDISPLKVICAVMAFMLLIACCVLLKQMLCAVFCPELLAIDMLFGD